MPLRSIDVLSVEWEVSRLDFIKIDIEGFEQDAPTGAQATPARFDPLVMLAFHAWRQIAAFDRNPRRFLEWLLDTFAVLHVRRHGRLRSMREVGVHAFLHTHLIGTIAIPTCSRRTNPSGSSDCRRPWRRRGAVRGRAG